MRAAVRGSPLTFREMQQRFPGTARSTLRFRIDRLVKLGLVERSKKRPAKFVATRP